MGIFDKIDFNNLPEHFKEDAVREDIILPLLQVLGYSRFNEVKRIISGHRLKHPFVIIGSSKHKINIIPDYIIKVDNKNVFIVEVKAPTENILKGRHVEQAYSYAYHSDVSVGIFVLCNGKELTVFSTAKLEMLLKITLADATEYEWGKFFELLSPAAFEFPHIFNYKQDYGVWFVQSGFPIRTVHNFYGVYVDTIARLNDSSYTIQATIVRDENEYYASFDFDRNLFEALLLKVPTEKKVAVRQALTNYPFRYMAACEADSFKLSFSALLGTEMLSDERNIEKYIPFNIVSFM